MVEARGKLTTAKDQIESSHKNLMTAKNGRELHKIKDDCKYPTTARTQCPQNTRWPQKIEDNCKK